ncbi:nose resistant to fluoxetine protein 6-like [Anneissia japonica]|uniref:nose resistant to fluoxetine protein 6-like n=1 Tax=Anneissia japonica TaxID=1529436 RepID=UPI001425ACB2|nr:nose resistant to fluoxetine protein 6-like [Anneissia japonica]
MIRLHKERKSKESGNVTIQLEGSEATPEETSVLNDDSKIKKENGDQNEVAVVEESKEKPTEDTKKKGLGIGDLVRAFSLVENVPKILNTEVRPGSFPALNGIRVLSMCWIILGHTIQVMGYRLESVGYVLTTILPKFYFMTVWNATFAVDTFFLLSGLLLCYHTLKTLKKCDGKLNWGLFYFHRWWRITPVYIMALAIWSSLLIHLASGPYANATFNYARQLCRDNWWTNLLYINNLYPFSGNGANMCMGWSWYLAADMQFFIITPPLLVLLFKRPRLGLTAVAVVCGVSFIITASLTGYWGLKAGLNYGFYNNRSVEETDANRISYKPYTRMSTFLVGILTGYVMFAYESRRPKIPKWGLAVGWSVSIILAMVVIFSVWKTDSGKELRQGAAIMYYTFSRFSFALAVAWVILVCVFDYGGPVNMFLSWGIWAPLARLTFCAYLLHPMLLFLCVLPRKFLFDYWGFQTFCIFIATIVLSYAAAFVLSVLVEVPTMGLEKMFFRKKK